MSWQNYVTTLSDSLCALEANAAGGQSMGVETAFKHWHALAESVRKENGVIYLIGNGASASMASHFAADLFKNGGIRTQIFTDPAGITAIGNDVSFDQVFALPLERCACRKDVLVAISSSGQSVNILNAVRAAKNKLATVVTLSSFLPGNALRLLGDINFYVPATTYGIAESSHAAILHAWMDSLL
ncbi:MAG: SIS domain-containing protein [Desulfobulbus sp.]|jgi:D-sedoheptulose 7-phosphate isomerase